MLEFLNKPKTYLITANVLLAFFLILLNNLKVLPLEWGDFLFFLFLTLAFAMYRPGWCFLIFVGMIPLENINLVPAELGISVRPYQFMGAIIVLALIIRFLTKRLSFKLAKPKWYDWLVIVFAMSGFCGVINAPDKMVSLKLSVVIGTFSVLYFLVRNYIQNFEDLKRVFPFFLSSSLVVVFYGIWQNWRFLHSLSNFEAMPGRPSATFTEPDWLGMYLVMLTSAAYVLIYFFQKTGENKSDEFKNQNAERKITIQNSKSFLVYIFLVFTFILLIITVSRSAWLGAFAAYAIFVLIFFTDLKIKNWKWRETGWLKIKIVLCLLAAVLGVYIFHLTNFQLFNRVESTGTGLQKITISCFDQDTQTRVPEKINNVSELGQYNCRHINLEEIESEKAAGKYVAEIYRTDPNVNIRGEIYKKSISEIKKHPILGIGWGNIGSILGTDERGIPLNSSNIFLESWLGAGILGFLSLVILFGYILVKAVRNYYRATDVTQKTINLLIIVSWFAIIIPNLFNAGIFLGFFWIWLGIAQVKN